MTKFFYIIITSLLFTHIGCLQANDKSKMLEDLNVIQSTFETKYAPYEWKKSYFGWSLKDEIQFAKIKILSLDSLTVKDYQKILHAFFISTRDYHVSDSYFSTEEAMLPFRVQSANGKYFVTETENDWLNEMKATGMYVGKRTIQMGDEIIQFDSQPISVVIDEIKSTLVGNADSKTSQHLAESLLTKRFGRLAHAVPKGKNNILFKTPEGEYIEAEITWLYLPEKIQDRSYSLFSIGETANFDASYEDDGEDPYAAFDPKPLNKTPFSLVPNLMINPLANALHQDYPTAIKKMFKHPPRNAATHLLNQATNSDDPTNSDDSTPSAIQRDAITFGDILWKESPPSPFNVHIYQHPNSNKRIGYIRIGTYSPTPDQDALTLLVIRLAKSIRYLEVNSDAVVVDQVDNPGGDGHYALAITSLLTNRPLELPNIQIALTQAEVSEALDTLDELEDFDPFDEKSFNLSSSSSFFAGYPLDKNFIDSLTAYNAFLVEQWNEGKTLTTPYPMFGIVELSPHPIANYSKPILFLVDGNTFSCGDFVPAILQDNKRATIFGEKTAGAGGRVQMHTYPNSFGLAGFSFTASIIQRLNGNFIENLGVTPDVLYDLTSDDLLNGYQGYIKAVNSTLEKMNIPLTSNLPIATPVENLPKRKESISIIE